MTNAQQFVKDLSRALNLRRVAEGGALLDRKAPGQESVRVTPMRRNSFC